MDFSFARAWVWGIDKDVDATVKAGGPDGDGDGAPDATFEYTLTPSASIRYTEWQLSGTITVENPNPWPVEATAVADLVDLGEGLSCSIVDVGPLPEGSVTIPGEGTRTFDVRCTYTGEIETFDGILTGKNVARVEWDADQAFSPTDAAQYTLPANAIETSNVLIDQWAVITDDLAGQEPVTLGTCEASRFAAATGTGVRSCTVDPAFAEDWGGTWDAEAGTFRYSLTHRVPRTGLWLEDGYYTNTATATPFTPPADPDDTPSYGEPVTDDVTVQVLAYDLALRSWVAGVYRSPSQGPVIERTGEIDVQGRPGPIYPVPYSSFDQEADILPGDYLAKDVLVFNQGNSTARVTELTYAMPPGMMLAAAEVQQHAWTLERGGGLTVDGLTGDRAVLDLSGYETAVLGSKEHLVVEIWLQLESVEWFLNQAHWHQQAGDTPQVTGGPSPKFTGTEWEGHEILRYRYELESKLGQLHVSLDGYAEITGFEGWLPAGLDEPVEEPADSPSPEPSGAPEPQPQAGGPEQVVRRMAAVGEVLVAPVVTAARALWGVVVTALDDDVVGAENAEGQWLTDVLDIDSTPGDENHLTEAVLDNAMDTNPVSGEHCTYDLDAIDEDDHDGETVRVLILTSPEDEDLVYDAALRVWTEGIYRLDADGTPVQLFESHADDEHPGPDTWLSHTAADDDKLDVEVGDLLVLAIHLFNQGNTWLRIDELTHHIPDGFDLAPEDLVEHIAFNDEHSLWETNDGWLVDPTHPENALVYLPERDWARDDIVLAPDDGRPGGRDEHEVHLTLIVTPAVFGDADAEEAEVHNFTEISRMSGLVPVEVAPQADGLVEDVVEVREAEQASRTAFRPMLAVEAAVMPAVVSALAAEPVTPQTPGWAWAPVEDVDSTPDNANVAWVDGAVSFRSYEDNEIHENATEPYDETHPAYALYGADPYQREGRFATALLVDVDNDEDDHDGLRTVVARTVTPVERVLGEQGSRSSLRLPFTGLPAILPRTGAGVLLSLMITVGLLASGLGLRRATREADAPAPRHRRR